MGWLPSVLHNATAETPLIFSVFHLLVAGLTLVVLLYQSSSTSRTRTSDGFLVVAFIGLVTDFGLLTIHFGARLFLHPSLHPARVQRLGHGLFTFALLLLVAAFQGTSRRGLPRWLLPACAAVLGLALGDTLAPTASLALPGAPHSVPMLINDVAALLFIVLLIRACIRAPHVNSGYVVTVSLLGLAVLLHAGSCLLPGEVAVVAWNAEQVALSGSLVGFAWLAGERSTNLLGRIFVRLNLTFIVLATVVMLVTTAMQRYQYIRLAEQRSMELGDFLRDQVLHYHERGEVLSQIARRSSITDRIATEFVKIPELRRVDIHLGGESSSFVYTQQAWRLSASPASAFAPEGNFSLLRLPLGSGASDRVELFCTLDYINHYTGTYVLFIYAVFTVIVLLSTCIIGIIVAETDRQLQRKYAELQETHEQLAQAAKLASVGELAGGMAHQINTPITSILSLATHMADEKNTGGLTARQRKSLEIIAQQAQRTSMIVRGLLNFSRQSRLRLAQVELSGVLDTALSLVQYRLEGSSIYLHRNLQPGLPPIHADAGALTEVVVNLLNNAIDAMPGGGTLTLHARREGEHDVRLEVSDTGVGIAGEQLRRIFDPFYTTKEPGRGTGLGLAISHGIVKNHGGDIWAQSEPGHGTTIAVRLPRESVHEETYSCRR